VLRKYSTRNGTGTRNTTKNRYQFLDNKTRRSNHVTRCGGVTVGGGLEKLSQGRNFFFLMPAPAQLSAYANHEFKIIPTPAQLSAYANHKLKNRYYLAKVARRQTA